MGEGKVLWKPQLDNKEFQCELRIEKKTIMEPTPVLQLNDNSSLMVMIRG